MEHFINIFPAQKLFAQFLAGQSGADNILVDLRQHRLQAGHADNTALDFRPTQQLRCLQPMQASDKRVILVEGDRVE